MSKAFCHLSLFQASDSLSLQKSLLLQPNYPLIIIPLLNLGISLLGTFQWSPLHLAKPHRLSEEARGTGPYPLWDQLHCFLPWLSSLLHWPSPASWMYQVLSCPRLWCVWPFPPRLLFSLMLAWQCLLATWVWGLTWPSRLKEHSPNHCLIFFMVLHPLTWMLLYLIFAFSTGRWAPWGHHCLSGLEWCWSQSNCLLNNSWVTEEGTSMSVGTATLLLPPCGCLSSYPPPSLLSLNSFKSICISNRLLLYFPLNKLGTRKLVSNLLLIVGCLISVCISFLQLCSTLLEVK